MNMRFQITIATLMLGVAMSLPAAAQSRDSFDALTALESIRPGALFKGIIREDDVSLLFRHWRESMAASTRGEAAPPSDAMKRRSEQIQRDVAARGSVLAGVLLSALEQAARRVVSEGLEEFSGEPGSPQRDGTPRHVHPVE